MSSADTAKSTLLICTLGGSPDPVVASILRWKPVRMYFVHTPETRGYVAQSVVPAAAHNGVSLEEWQYELHELPDAQHFARCLEHVRRLSSDVHKWAARGENFQVVVDFTGGTKCMSAAMALQASRWPCIFSYVGGTERSKGGTGVVVSGSELITHADNPWDALGYQAIEDFIVLFDQGAYPGAAKLAETTKQRVSNTARQREFAVLQNLALALDAWDRFEHKASLDRLQDVAKAANDLHGALGHTRGARILLAVEALQNHLQALLAQCDAQGTHMPSVEVIRDLVGNATRRRDEGRFDDAVARLYRAIEAIAQHALWVRHGIASVNGIPLDRLAPALQVAWEPRAQEGMVRLGLQDLYRLCAELGDPVADTFQALGLNTHRSALSARNRSILAHGFELVSKKDCNQLLKHTLTLAAIEPGTIPAFPAIGGG